MRLSPQMVRLRPAPHCRPSVLGYALAVEPAEHFRHWQLDANGNTVARLVFPRQTDELEILVDLVVDTTPLNPFDFFLEPHVATFPFTYEPQLEKELGLYREVETPSEELERFVSDVDRSERCCVEFLVELNRRIHERVQYVARTRPGVQPCSETLESWRGSCRDSAWLLAETLRAVGLASRYVSGYLVQLRSEESPGDGPDEDTVDLHAWAEVYLPGAGWVGLDPTSGLLAGEGHIPLACSHAPGGATPVSGSTEPCEVDFDWSLSLTRHPELA